MQMEDFQKMLNYVKKVLEENDAIRPTNPRHQFRSRYTHTLRVLEWCKRIKSDKPKCNLDILYTAAIFHDSGYAVNKNNHAYFSSKIFIDYAKENNFNQDFIDKVSNIVLSHSDKKLLNDPSSSDELILLLEADLLDEEGALGIIWDLMAEGQNNPSDYGSALNALWIHSAHILNQDYMVTPLAKEYWNKKKEIVKNFISDIEEDLFIEVK